MWQVNWVHQRRRKVLQRLQRSGPQAAQVRDSGVQFVHGGILHAMHLSLLSPAKGNTPGTPTQAVVSAATSGTGWWQPQTVQVDDCVGASSRFKITAAKAAAAATAAANDDDICSGATASAGIKAGPATCVTVAADASTTTTTTADARNAGAGTATSTTKDTGCCCCCCDQARRVSERPPRNEANGTSGTARAPQTRATAHESQRHR